jgi:hypothetical protein
MRAYPITVGDLISIAAAELRAHGFREQSLDMANRAVTWYRSISSETMSGSRYREGLAAAYYAAERWEEASTLFEGLVQGRVERVDNSAQLDQMILWGFVGVLAARDGDRATAMNISQQLASVSGYTMGWNTYLRACIAAQLGEKNAAVELLRRAFAAGKQMSLKIHRNIDLEPLWNDPEFQELIEPKG